MKKQHLILLGITGSVLALLGAIALALMLLVPANNSPAAARLIYLVAEKESETQVWELDWETQREQQLAQVPGTMLHYDISTATEQLVGSVERSDGGHDLWKVVLKRGQAQLWLACAPDDCRDPVWAPDGEAAVYTRVKDGEATLWWMERQSGKTRPLFADTPIDGRLASWSPGGERLAYVDPSRQVCIVALADQAPQCVPASMESSALWYPDGEKLLVGDMRMGSAVIQHLLQFDLTLNLFLDLSADYYTEDDAPAWSPDGSWIVFRRSAAGTSMGKQLWLMRADGSEAHTLTEEATYHYGPPVWSDDGETLFATRYAQDGSHAIWAINTVDGSKYMLTRPGYAPTWLSE